MNSALAIRMRFALVRVSLVSLIALWTISVCSQQLPELSRVGIGQATRIIFNEKDSSVAIPVRNISDVQYLVRTYIVDSKSHSTARQLYVAPEVVRLAPHTTQSCRIVRLTNDFPSDRESLFYLRGLFIPASYEKGERESQTASASFTVALQMNLKLFYRPRALEHSNATAWASSVLSVARREKTIECRNTTPYYLTLSELKVQGNTCDLTQNNSMLAPFSTQQFRVQGALMDDAVSVTWRAIDDYGNRTPEMEVTLK